MTKRIFRSICLVALAVFLAALVLIMGVLYSYSTQVHLRQLRTETALAAQGVAKEGISFFDGLSAVSCRITWIASDGTVLYDNRAQAGSLENHLQREEIANALQTGYAESARYSASLAQYTLYCAQRLDDGTVLRLSIAQDSVLTLIVELLPPFCVVIIIALFLSLALASRISKQIVKPLNELDLDNPLSNADYAELSPLLHRIDSQQQQLRSQASELKSRQRQFDTVTSSMSEGLILLNSEGTILSMNSAAANLMNTGGGCTGQELLSIHESPAMREAISRALSGVKTETTIQLPTGEYQMDASPVRSDGRVTGVVLLLFDVTEKKKAELLRQEFTANVSHELKTPLHAISGYAELLKSGMVLPQDVPQFTERIYNEAQRLILLVEDIIRLSRLDEGGEDTKWEAVELYKLAADTIYTLSSEAESAAVRLTLKGSPVTVNAIPYLLSGILTNLCDNAIKYNHRGGSVCITIGTEKGTPFLSVADSGIGIPIEHRERIFERFYRVDKSHSKEVGGTGLGLSIVKHAALILGAKIQLDSTIGQGTTVTVWFPK